MHNDPQWQHLEPTAFGTNSSEIGIPPPPPLSNPYEDIGIPLLQPKSPHKSYAVVWVASGSAILLICAAVLFYWSYTYRLDSSKSTPIVIFVTPTPKRQETATLQAATPSPLTNYTATDIMRDFVLAGIHPPYVSYGYTIWSWSGDTFYVSVHATSSVTWTDDSQCTGYCDPANLGLWVYSSSSLAQEAYAEVGNDEIRSQLTPPTGPPIVSSSTSEYVHGRCLLIGAPLTSVYVQVTQHNCI